MDSFLDKFFQEQPGASVAYFLNGPLKIDFTENGEINESYEFSLEIKHSVPSNIRTFSFKIQQTPHLYAVMREILNNLDHFKERASNEIKISVPPSPEFIGGSNINRLNHTIYFYTQDELTDKEKLLLSDYMTDKEFLIQVRGPKYMELQNSKKKTHTFISHDFKDRAMIGTPLANGLLENECPVWFNSIEIGENILEAIEKGIKESRKCVLVISPNYLANVRYAHREFEAIISKEMIKKEKVILPIWYNVTEDEVGEYSLSLVSTFAYVWPSLDEQNPTKYHEDVGSLIKRLSDYLKKN